MTELHADEGTAAFVRAQAGRAGISEREWLARHFRQVAVRESADAHAEWYAQRSGLLEDEVTAAQAAFDEAGAA